MMWNQRSRGQPSKLLSIVEDEDEHGAAGPSDTRTEWETRLLQDVVTAAQDGVHLATSKRLKQLFDQSSAVFGQIQKSHSTKVDELQARLEAQLASSRRLQEENQSLREQIDLAMRAVAQLVEARLAGAAAAAAPAPAPPLALLAAPMPSKPLPVGLVPARPNPAGSKAAVDAAAEGAFTLTLRRSAGSPLGLVVQPDFATGALRVVGTQPGSVAEAWNIQNAGGARELRRGDRIVSVNGVDDVEGMRAEFYNSHLLKIAIERGGARAVSAATVGAAAASAAVVAASAGDLLSAAAARWNVPCR
eukprot:TRINITY_DN62752_c0_g1_i1.p2 TRINITY_DN62752_c0_g1~~TRINITY_DN62752_c0_g1_i1.p2  ORF type:complete len:317 (-),score=88.56 TRINITY_DN62752_c0_g1_i1:502-1413(-)